MTPHYAGFIWYRAIAQLRSESSRAYLGYLWWVLEPLLYLSVFYLVFGLVFSRGDENYLEVLLIGLVVWKWFDGSVRSSMDVIQQNSGLIDKVYLPKIVLPSVSVVSNGVKFALIFVLLLAFALLFGSGFSVYWLALLPLLLLQFLLVFSASCLAAAVTPFLPDIKLVFDKVMTLLFFMSGIFYTLDSIPPNLLLYFNLNPMFALITCYRDVLVYQQWPAMGSLIYILLLSLGLLLFGVTLLKRYDRIYPRLIY